MPPVCSNSVRRSAVSLTPKRSAMPGRYQTGSIAALVTATSPVVVHDLAVDLEPARGDGLADLAAAAAGPW